MNNQELLLRTIQKKLEKNNSIIEAIARILDISYDASHRRVSMKSKFSIEEAVLLCKHFNISMDNLAGQTNKILVKKTSEINSTNDLTLYLKESYEHLKEFSNRETKIYYSAKDIPLFYTIGGTLLSKFKLYVWSNLLINNQENIPFENFQIQTNILEYTSKLQKLYDEFDKYEIWNDTTINSSLQQIFYFFESGLLQRETTLNLYEDIISIIKQIEYKTSLNNNNYNLYLNELLILNNNVLVESNERTKLFIPYTVLGYMITTDENTTSNTKHFLKHQIKISKHLNNTGTRDRKIFFNKAINKTEWYIDKVKKYINENIF